MMSLPAISFGDRFCFSRKDGIGGGGWVHPKGTNSMVASGLGCRNDLVGTGRPFCCHKWNTNKQSPLQGLHLLH